jgi:hypothetical protein
VYAESVEKKLKLHGLVVECAHLPETVPLLDELDDASKRGVLFGIIISSQHEVHRSVTVHILHGTQQGKFCFYIIWVNTCAYVVNKVVQCVNETMKIFWKMIGIKLIFRTFRQLLLFWGVFISILYPNLRVCPQMTT